MCLVLVLRSFSVYSPVDYLVSLCFNPLWINWNDTMVILEKRQGWGRMARKLPRTHQFGSYKSEAFRTISGICSFPIVPWPGSRLISKEQSSESSWWGQSASHGFQSPLTIVASLRVRNMTRLFCTLLRRGFLAIPELVFCQRWSVTVHDGPMNR